MSLEAAKQFAESSGIVADSLCFTYERISDRSASMSQRPALDHCSFSIEEGSFVAILGENGSGKSTLARHINVLLQPQSGEISVFSMPGSDPAYEKQIRRSCGMVFQNPDNQIVATTVEEDAAFGLENLGIPAPEIRQRVAHSLELLKISELAKRSPDTLSGGQKQKLALAGILAMNPRCFIFDEATSMLDPQMRHELLRFVAELRRQNQLTMILVTHFLEEALAADRILYLQEGRLILDMPPREFFAEAAIHLPQLEVPSLYALLRRLEIEGLGSYLDLDGRSPERLAPLVYQRLGESRSDPVIDQRMKALQQSLSEERRVRAAAKPASDPVLRVDRLSFSYSESSAADQSTTLSEVSFELNRGECLAICGPSGAGKSTLIMHLNGLLQIQSGEIQVLDMDLKNRKNLKQLRRKIALLFQYPEHQLFAETLIDDIAFGPKALGVPAHLAYEKASAAALLMGFSEADFQRSPFSFSGGQMRRAALAGLLASDPEILVLDEPAAGLDPQSKRQLLEMLKDLQRQGLSLILVSHDVNDMANYADRILLLNHGQVVSEGSAQEILCNEELMRANGLELPDYAEFLKWMPAELNIKSEVLCLEDCLLELLESLLKQGA